MLTRRSLPKAGISTTLAVNNHQAHLYFYDTVVAASPFGILQEWLNFAAPVRLTGIYFTTKLVDSVTGKGISVQSAKLDITGVAQQIAQGSALYTSAGGPLKGPLVISNDVFVPLDLTLNPADGNLSIVARQYYTNLLADAIFHAHVIFYYEDL